MYILVCVLVACLLFVLRCGCLRRKCVLFQLCICNASHNYGKARNNGTLKLSLLMRISGWISTKRVLVSEPRTRCATLLSYKKPHVQCSTQSLAFNSPNSKGRVRWMVATTSCWHLLNGTIKARAPCSTQSHRQTFFFKLISSQRLMPVQTHTYIPIYRARVSHNQWICCGVQQLSIY